MYTIQFAANVHTLFSELDQVVSILMKCGVNALSGVCFYVPAT